MYDYLQAPSGKSKSSHWLASHAICLATSASRRHHGQRSIHASPISPTRRHLDAPSKQGRLLSGSACTMHPMIPVSRGPHVSDFHQTSTAHPPLW